MFCLSLESFVKFNNKFIAIKKVYRVLTTSFNTDPINIKKHFYPKIK